MSGRSWDPLDPDGTIGLARTKKLLGEFVVPRHGKLVPCWSTTRGRSIHPAPRALPHGHPCLVQQDHQVRSAAALQEVVDAGLAGYIDVANTNTYGGCFGPRFSRIVGDSARSLSRHTWAQALDTNTVSNCQGCVPQMDCRVVRIFRAHNFAWGGNFLNPDGMHFEWVGEPRNNYQYPSRYCPNVAGGADRIVATTRRTHDRAA